MSVATSTALIIGGGLAAGASLGGALVQSNSASNAENTQATEAANSLAFNENVFNTEQANEAPWLQAGQTALGQLSAGTAAGGQFTTPYSGTFNPGAFTAPTGLTEQNDPGFQARLQLGQQALEETQAAQGITGGGALQAAEQYGQTFATNDYQNVYNNALNSYNANYQSGLGAFNTNYNVWANNQANQFNRLAALSGSGQTAVGQLNQAGQSAASNATNINTNLGNQVSNLQTGQGNVLASGLGGAASAVNGGLSNYQNYNMLQAILNQNNSGYAAPANGSGLPNQYYPPGPYDATSP